MRLLAFYDPEENKPLPWPRYFDLMHGLAIHNPQVIITDRSGLEPSNHAVLQLVRFRARRWMASRILWGEIFRNCSYALPIGPKKTRGHE